VVDVRQVAHREGTQGADVFRIVEQPSGALS
jgi:hypothetical protein